MGREGLAAHQKKACRLNAWLVFIDESCFLMAPLVRRTWWPTGHTPVLHQKGRSHDKVSVIAALCVTPARDRVHLYFRMYPDANVDAQGVKDFLAILARQLGEPAVIVWDRLNTHRALAVQAFMESVDLHSELLPPYAPELTPVENVWGYLKINPLANWAPTDLTSLVTRSRHHARSVQRKEPLLRSFLAHSPLSLRLK